MPLLPDTLPQPSTPVATQQLPGASTAALKPAAPKAAASKPAPAPALHPDPTRYGDWERAGRCIDF
jgi:hypothetical protein